MFRYHEYAAATLVSIFLHWSTGDLETAVTMSLVLIFVATSVLLIVRAAEESKAI